MLKFTVVEWKHQTFKNDLIHFMAKKMKLLQGNNFSLRDQQNIIFIITEEVKKGIMGGACVLKNELVNIQEDVRELITTLAHNNGYVWECSRVYIETPSKHIPLGTPESQHFYQAFYRGLYEGLVKFGKKKRVGFVVMKLTAEDYASTKEYGLWPYVVELRPENSPDGLFHGILPLIGSQYETYQKAWDALDNPSFE